MIALVLLKLHSAKPQRIGFFASDFKVAQFLSSNHMPNFPNLDAYELWNSQNHPIGWKNNKIVDFGVIWIANRPIDCSSGCLNPWNWWKNVLGHWKGSKILWIDGKLANLKKKFAAASRHMKSSPILGHPPNSLTCGRRFESSPNRVNWCDGNSG